MTKLDKAATIHNCKFYWDWCFFVTVRKQFSENPNKNYHVYYVIVVLHIYSKILGIRLVGHPANKTKSLILIKF